MATFKVGDSAVIVNGVHQPHLNGLIVKITQTLRYVHNLQGMTGGLYNDWVYGIDFGKPTEPSIIYAGPQYLRPLQKDQPKPRAARRTAPDKPRETV